MAPTSINPFEGNTTVYMPGSKQAKHTQVRFDLPPASIVSDRSGTITASPEPSSSAVEQCTLDANRDHELEIEYLASQPKQQFKQQVLMEKQRLIKQHYCGIPGPSTDIESERIAKDHVKQEWIEQGIWDDESLSFPNEEWKHEKSLQPNVPSNLHLDASTLQEDGKTDLKKSQEQMLQRSKDCDRSRPFYQFMYQISKERERLQKQSSFSTENYAKDVNTQVYNTIKSVWSERKIWDEKWGTIPGMLWKHEQPWKEFLKDTDTPTPSVKGHNLHLPTSGNPPRSHSTFANHAQNQETCDAARICHKRNLGGDYELFGFGNHSTGNVWDEIPKTVRTSLFATPTTYGSHKPSIMTAPGRNRSHKLNENCLEIDENIPLYNNDSQFPPNEKHQATAAAISGVHQRPITKQFFFMEGQVDMMPYCERYQAFHSFDFEGERDEVCNKMPSLTQQSRVFCSGNSRSPVPWSNLDINTSGYPFDDIHSSQQFGSCHLESTDSPSYVGHKAERRAYLDSLARPQHLSNASCLRKKPDTTEDASEDASKKRKGNWTESQHNIKRRE